MHLVVAKKVVTFEPGELGADIDEDGEVLSVGRGQAHEQGVKKGWILLRIQNANGKPTEYSPGLIAEQTTKYRCQFEVLKDPPPNLIGKVVTRNENDCFINMVIDGIPSPLALGGWRSLLAELWNSCQ